MNPDKEDFGLYIVRVSNGYIAKGLNDPEEVFEEMENCPQDVDADTVARLLWKIIEYFGEGGSRYDAKRVRVVVEPGDKYEGKV
jgi:hypothetical protein